MLMNAWLAPAVTMTSMPCNPFSLATLAFKASLRAVKPSSGPYWLT